MNGFQIQSLPGKGRAMISTKLFKTGETIFEEEPFVSCQFSWNCVYGYKACDYCMRPMETAEENVRRLTNDQTIILPYPECCPTQEWLKYFTTCKNCGASYCSEDCRIEALKKYHKASCINYRDNNVDHPVRILEETWKQLHYPPETGSIILIVRLLAMYKQSQNKQEFLDILQSFRQDIINEELMIIHKMLGDNFEHQLTQLFQAFYNAFHLDEDCSRFTNPDAFKSLLALISTNNQGLATSPFAEWVRKVSQLNLSSNERLKVDNYIDELYHKLNEFVGEFLNNEGSGLYILQSKINHSCAPNAQSSFPYSNDIVVLKALKDIQPGEEITVSYLDDLQLEKSRHSRHKLLKLNYLFVCKCTKCEAQANDPDVTSDEDELDDIEMNDEME